MKFNINKNDKLPIHRQIINQIEFMIESGVLRGGDKLPTERALSEQYDVARGTVNAAYLELARMGKVLTVRGSGTYVTKIHTDVEQGYIRSQIDSLLQEAAMVGITENNVLELMDQEIRRRQRGFTQVHAAWVGCCAEVQRMTEPTLSMVPLVQIKSFHIDEILENPELLDDDFDLIVTTEFPYEALVRAVPLQADKIVRVTLDLNDEHTFKLSLIHKNQKTVMLGAEKIFIDTVQEQLSLSDNLQHCKYYLPDTPGLDAALAQADVLILPDLTHLQDHKYLLKTAREFEQRGKPVLFVAYQMDRGSVIYFESEVKQCWIGKCRTGITNTAKMPDYHMKSAPKRKERRF